PEQPSIDTPAAWAPFSSHAEFDFAHFHFVKLQASEGKINKSLDIIHVLLLTYADPPFSNTNDLYATIDSIQEENTPWTTHYLSYSGTLPDNLPRWMTESYVLCMRNALDVVSAQLCTKSFHGKFNYTPYEQRNAKGERVFSNLMSGIWAWEAADKLRDDPVTCDASKGGMLVPIILGSDKTTVSVATGHQEYHPCYILIGNLTT
ncbi:hypothetical protein MPER_15922, partial [Moniliophthora perniciosa FA553]